MPAWLLTNWPHATLYCVCHERHCVQKKKSDNSLFQSLWLFIYSSVLHSAVKVGILPIAILDFWSQLHSVMEWEWGESCSGKVRQVRSTPRSSTVSPSFPHSLLAPGIQTGDCQNAKFEASNSSPKTIGWHHGGYIHYFHTVYAPDIISGNRLKKHSLKYWIEKMW